ncbi:MAG: flagellar hook capping FlgD N-terminal domain-containing protein [Anaerovoracaceae bacterium]
MRIDESYPYSATSETTASKNSNGLLGMDDFFKLLVAQLSNQDMFNTVDDTQFISQMAQFSMVQALSEMSQASSTAYSMNLIGKEVIVAVPAEDGTLIAETGLVDSVILYGGSPEIIVNGERYKLSNIMEVRTPNIIVPENRIGETDPEDSGEADHVE